MNNTIKKLKEKAKQLKSDTYALFLAYKDKRVKWYAKIFIIIVISYALSPIDLIPDFIPILGLLDDIILVPLGIYFALKMIPQDIMEECREKARIYLENNKKPKNWIVGIIIILIWILFLFIGIKFIINLILN
ncbi:MAG: hypothetical protein A2086_04975 [Spirochaetes bacterium GWD1_27_9]|nr:MAG: hypothetical protein A2Z98_09740 [Spirochaetes bacterium GWB1_27_13]OHD20770.1 MAG: hypothetical protein A2Y34_01830 [Spirochaetes bacterium GWC1_27_15]OHD30085.1 MAG: hypothetical protein A2086_04975 [Spirochaetes bacterium GWD1_27_9]